MEKLQIRFETRDEINNQEWDSEVGSRYVDLSKVCRLCLKKGQVMCPIFGAPPVNGTPPISLSARIMACAKVNVFEGDGLPTHMCTACLTQLNSCYQFKVICERSDSILRGRTQVDSETESEGSGGEEAFDMTKFTPEVIISEPSEGGGGGPSKPAQPLGLLAIVAAAAAQHHQQQAQHQQQLQQPQPPPQQQQKQQPQPPPQQPQQQQPPPQTSPDSSRSRRAREGEKAFKCNMCSKSYSFSSALSRHKAVHNTSLRPHVCQVCQRGFTQVEKLLRHLRGHTIDTPVSCDHCSASFDSFDVYEQHMLSRSCKRAAVLEPKSSGCSTCGQPECSGCEEPRNGAEDDRRGRGGRGKGKPEFQCKVCSKCFASRGSLEVHSTIHTGLRPFVCTACSQSFRHKVNLMEHYQRKHSQVRPYICDVCATRFVTKQELVRHYKKHIGD